MVGGTIILEGTNPLVLPLIEFYEQGLALDEPPDLHQAPGSIMNWLRETICDRFRVDVMIRDPEEPLERTFMPDSTNHINYLALYAVRFAFDHVSDVMMFKLTWL